MHVSILSFEDAGKPVIEAAIARSTQKEQEEPSDIFSSQHRLRKHIMATNKVCQSEPRLLLKVGQSLSLDGFPAWLLRLAEIGHVPSADEITVQNLQDALNKYATTEQRFGK